MSSITSNTNYRSKALIADVAAVLRDTVEEEQRKTLQRFEEAYRHYKETPFVRAVEENRSITIRGSNGNVLATFDVASACDKGNNHIGFKVGGQGGCVSNKDLVGNFQLKIPGLEHAEGENALELTEGEIELSSFDVDFDFGDFKHFTMKKHDGVDITVTAMMDSLPIHDEMVAKALSGVHNFSELVTATGRDPYQVKIVFQEVRISSLKNTLLIHASLKRLLLAASEKDGTRSPPDVASSVLYPFLVAASSADEVTTEQVKKIEYLKETMQNQHESAEKLKLMKKFVIQDSRTTALLVESDIFQGRANVRHFTDAVPRFCVKFNGRTFLFGESAVAHFFEMLAVPRLIAVCFKHKANDPEFTVTGLLHGVPYETLENLNHENLVNNKCDYRTSLMIIEELLQNADPGAYFIFQFIILGHNKARSIFHDTLNAFPVDDPEQEQE